MVCVFSSQQPEVMRNSGPEAHLHLSAHAGVSGRAGRESRTTGSGVGVEKFSSCTGAQSIPIKTSEPVKQRPGACRPGSRSANLPEVGRLGVSFLYKHAVYLQATGAVLAETTLKYGGVGYIKATFFPNVGSFVRLSVSFKMQFQGQKPLRNTG